MRQYLGVALVVFVFGAQVFPVSVHAQTQNGGVVRGRVIDIRGAALVRVKVTVGTLWGYSDTTGHYLVSRVPFGTYNVTLERDGRKVVKRQVDVRKPITDVPDLIWP